MSWGWSRFTGAGQGLGVQMNWVVLWIFQFVRQVYRSVVMLFVIIDGQSGNVRQAADSMVIERNPGTSDCGAISLQCARVCPNDVARLGPVMSPDGHNLWVEPQGR